MRPESMEFSKETIVEALKRANFTCECCGIKKQDTQEKYFEIHHRLGIAIALRYHPELSHALISSLANAMVLCIPCHKVLDREDRKHHKKIAKALQNLIHPTFAKAGKRL